MQATEQYKYVPGCSPNDKQHGRIVAERSTIPRLAPLTWGAAAGADTAMHTHTHTHTHRHTHTRSWSSFRSPLSRLSSDMSHFLSTPLSFRVCVCVCVCACVRACVCVCVCVRACVCDLELRRRGRSLIVSS